MRRRGEEALGLSDLDDLAEVHHRDSVAHVADHRDVVRDEEEREPERVAELVDEVENLRLYGDIERRHRLVRHDQLRACDDRTGDPDSLALTTRELMRIAIRVRRIEADEAQHLGDPCAALGCRADAVNSQRVTDDRTDTADAG